MNWPKFHANLSLGSYACSVHLCPTAVRQEASCFSFLACFWVGGFVQCGWPSCAGPVSHCTGQRTTSFGVGCGTLEFQIPRSQRQTSRRKMTLRKTWKEGAESGKEQRKQRVYFKYPPDRRKVAITGSHRGAPPNNRWSDEDENTGAYSSPKGNGCVLDAVIYCLKKGRNPRKSEK